MLLLWIPTFLFSQLVHESESVFFNGEDFKTSKMDFVRKFFWLRTRFGERFICFKPTEKHSVTSSIILCHICVLIFLLFPNDKSRCARYMPLYMHSHEIENKKIYFEVNYAKRRYLELRKTCPFWREQFEKKATFYSWEKCISFNSALSLIWVHTRKKTLKLAKYTHRVS